MKLNKWRYKMEYKKVENEIDKLLSSDGLNSYERKLLRKIKEKFSKVNHKLKENNRQFVDLHMKNHEIEELKTKIKRMNRYFILNVVFFVVLVIGILIND